MVVVVLEVLAGTVDVVLVLLVLVAGAVVLVTATVEVVVATVVVAAVSGLLLSSLQPTASDAATHTATR